MGQVAIVIALRQDLGRSVTPIFLFMDHLATKMKKIYRLDV